MIGSDEIKKVLPSDYRKFSLAPLLEIPEVPKALWYRGVLPPPELKLLAIVGSREHTSYGEQVINYLISGLRDYPIGIVSGLALGVDGLAHRQALKNKLYTLAIPGSGLADKFLYPRTNYRLAREILESGGGLISELPPETKAATWTFPLRNRIMAGLCTAVLLIEAGAKSGTLITARLTVEYNRELLAVPGNIFSKNSYGTHQFLKLGATMVTEPEDILFALQIEAESKVEKLQPSPLTTTEESVIRLLREPTDRDQLLRSLKLSVSEANTLLMNMEIQGYIRYEAPFYRSLI